MKMHLRHGGRSACRYSSRPSRRVRIAPTIQAFADTPIAQRCAECNARYERECAATPQLLEKDMNTFRAAYWVSADGQSDVLLTSVADRYLPDDVLMHLATEEALIVGLPLDAGEIHIGDYTAK